MGSASTAKPDDEEPRTLVGALRALISRVIVRARIRPPLSVRFFRPKALKTNSIIAEVRKHGVLGAMRRTLPTLMVNVLAGMSLFKAYETSHRRWGRKDARSDAAACGAAAGMTHAAITCPLAALCAGRWRAPFAALRVYVARDVPGFAAFFGSWHVLHQQLGVNSTGSHDGVRKERTLLAGLRELGANVVAGGLAGGLYQLWASPFDQAQTHTHPSLRALQIEIRRVGWRESFGMARGSARGAVLASSLSFLTAELAFEDGLVKVLIAELRKELN